MILWKLLHTFGFIAWFVGLLATTGIQVSARKAKDASGRQTAWGAMRRFVPYEIAGLVVTPIAGLFLAKVIYGAYVPPKVVFVHIKLTLALIAVVANVLLILQRRKAEPLVAGGGPAFDKALKRMAMFQGIATLMLPLSVIVVIVLRYRGA